MFGAMAVLSVAPAVAGEADITNVVVTQSDNGQFQFAVSVLHDDEGWDHYADAFEIVSLDGEILATRVLLHPHVGEQPFTRSVSGVEIHEELTQIIVRAHDSVHAYGGLELIVDLPGRGSAN